MCDCEAQTLSNYPISTYWVSLAPKHKGKDEDAENICRVFNHSWWENNDWNNYMEREQRLRDLK